MRRYRDPATGAVGGPNAASPRAPAAAGPAALETGREPTEEPVRTAPGGVKVNLRGRHRPAVVRHVDGAASHECTDGHGTPP